MKARSSKELGDFTATPHLIPVSFLAIGIGIFATFVAWALLRLIGFFTNLFYFGRIDTALVSPAGIISAGSLCSCRCSADW